jgi:hypothetical protein
MHFKSMLMSAAILISGDAPVLAADAFANEYDRRMLLDSGDAGRPISIADW